MMPLTFGIFVASRSKSSAYWNKLESMVVGEQDLRYLR
jgi:hypothetical protein